MGEPSISMVRTSYKSIDVIYQDGARRLVVYCEMTGPKVPYAWVAGEECAKAWTDPAGEAIPPVEQEGIKARIAAWAKSQRTSIGFERSIPIAEIFAEYERKGWKREERPDGTVAFSRPIRTGWIRKLVEWLSR